MHNKKLCLGLLAGIMLCVSCSNEQRTKAENESIAGPANSTEQTSLVVQESNVVTDNEFVEGTDNMNIQSEDIADSKKRPSNFHEYAQWAQEKLVESYWHEEQQFMNNTYPYSVEREQALNYWWKAHAVDVMVDGYERTKEGIYKDRAERLVKGIISRNGSLYNSFYDDMEWLALACLRLYDNTGNEKMKEYAIKLWHDIKTAWWEDEIGGLAWNKDDGRKNRNACSNGPGSILAARLYQRFGDEEDLIWAKKIFEFEKQYLVDTETGIVFDGLVVEPDGNLNINKDWVFTYNMGTYIGAATELYSITEDDAYLLEAEKTAKASIERLVTVYGVLKSEGSGDGGMFKGILIRYMQKLYEVNQDPAIAEFILKNAKKLVTDGSTPDRGLFGAEWNKIPQIPLDLTNQLSGVFLLEAAAKIEER